MKIKRLYEYVEEPLRNHRLRMEKGYKPKYVSGMIGVRFQDDENIKHDDEEYGDFIDYHFDIFGDKQNKSSNRIIDYFENKFNIRMVNYGSSDDYYIYFKCKPGDEENIMNKLSNEKIVKDVDFVDSRFFEIKNSLTDIIDNLVSLNEEPDEISNDIFNKIILETIEKLKKLL